MRRFLRVVVWMVVFAACAAVGAVVAANTNPFPPGVEDPGARSDPAPSATPADEPAAVGAWLVRIDARTYHDLLVGGRCAANWRVVAGVTADEGPIDSAASATLEGELRCDEPTAQVQAEGIELRATGGLRNGELRFRLEETSRSPAGAQELSGFLETISRVLFEIAARDGATSSIDRELPDGGGGVFGIRVTATVSAAAP
ncbi:MAG TPA: hypothetical protein VNC60_02195 [Actinomycetota bacterium]|nr:hypothetical protein [Actinomycetota bacterium]